jgi:hypothetical protein
MQQLERLTTYEQMVLGWALGLLPGTAAGLYLPWEVSGAPCYVLAGILWSAKVPKALVVGVLCGALAAAASQGIGAQTAWVAGSLAIMGLVCHPTGSWVRWAPVLLYTFSVGLALLIALWRV